MYYNPNPAKSWNEWEKNIYRHLIEWIDSHPGCVVNDIRIHLDLLIKEKERFEREEKERITNNGKKRM